MRTILAVPGTSCSHCEQAVETALQGVSGVTDVAVDREDGRAVVEGDADVAVLVEALEDAGYTASA